MRSFFIVLLLLGLFGCVTEPKVDPSTPEGLFALGEFYQKQSRYEEAINQYKALSNKHPYSPLAVQSELSTADCYFERQDYAEAYGSYKVFKDLHPGHKKMAYVTYQAAESIFKQLPGSVDRDLTQAHQAIALYREISNAYPKSKHAKEAKEKSNKLMQMLADKDLYVADFYFKRKQYLRALTRYELFIQKHPSNIKTPHAIYRALKASTHLELPEKQENYKSKLLRLFPKSKEAKLALEGKYS